MLASGNFVKKKSYQMLYLVVYWAQCDSSEEVLSLTNLPILPPLSHYLCKLLNTDSLSSTTKTFSLCWCAKMFTSDCTWVHFLHDSHFKVKSLFPDVARQPRNVSFCPLLHALIMAFMQNRLDLQLHLVVMEFVTCVALQSISFFLTEWSPPKPRNEKSVSLWLYAP